MLTSLADDLSPKAAQWISQGLNSGDTQTLAVAECLNTIASNGDGQESDEFLQGCAEMIRDAAQSAVDALGDQPSTKQWTVFCQEASGLGTIWIEAVDATDVQNAKAVGLKQCAAEWGYEEHDIHVLGVAVGDVDVKFWEDHCNRKQDET